MLTGITSDQHGIYGNQIWSGLGFRYASPYDIQVTLYLKVMKITSGWTEVRASPTMFPVMVFVLDIRLMSVLPSLQVQRSIPDIQSEG